MRETRTCGSEGGEAHPGLPYPYRVDERIGGFWGLDGDGCGPVFVSVLGVYPSKVSLPLLHIS